MVGLLTLYHQEREKAELEQEKREKDIALGNPLLMPTRDTEVKRRYSGYSYAASRHCLQFFQVGR